MRMTRRRLRMEPASEDASVTPLELFFDLVFVFGRIRHEDATHGSTEVE